MIQTIKNAWKIPELRQKILFTLLLLVVFRLGSFIPVPFLDKYALEKIAQEGTNTIFGFLNVLSGGSFSNATIFAMSITPYINASIIMNLLTIAIPSLERLAKEGEEGRKKISQITRYVSIVIAVVQGYGYYALLRSKGAVVDQSVFAAFAIIATFTAGTAFLMWLGEQITEHGIGNGISIIIFANIIAGLPQALMSLSIYTKTAAGIAGLAALLVLVLLAVAFVVFMSNAERRIPVQYAKRVVGRKMYGGQSTHLPLKVNMSGVLPIIFASSITMLPATIASFFPPPQIGTFWYAFQKLAAPDSWLYAIIYFILIIAFNYFYTAVQFNPVEIANNMKKNGGFVPGIRPGKPTSDYVAKVLSKVTFVGALFLGLIACLPIVITAVFHFNIYLGGTSLLIVVGVALETTKQLESQMLMRHYKGFLE